MQTFLFSKNIQKVFFKNKKKTSVRQVFKVQKYRSLNFHRNGYFCTTLKNAEKHTRFIKEKALSLGFTSIGVARAGFLEEEASKLEQWLKSGYQGEMRYLENNFDKRLDPRLLVEGAKSVISLSYNYFPEKMQDNDAYKLAKYAYGQDYHHVVKAKLKKLMLAIQEEIGEVGGRAFTDSAPVLERAWAEKSGLGWRGKNSLLLQKQHGSFFFLAELVVDLELEYDTPFTTDHCGTCTQCIDVCPTEAILPNSTVDGSKCISYYTIELKNELPSSEKGKFEDWMFGCDLCQDVCPWNRFSKPHSEPLFEPHPDLLQMTKRDWEEVTEDVFQKVFQKSAVKRAKFSGLKRNIQFLKESSGR
jgi:epoxyqueuosine reductase